MATCCRTCSSASSFLLCASCGVVEPTKSLAANTQKPLRNGIAWRAMNQTINRRTDHSFGIHISVRQSLWPISRPLRLYMRQAVGPAVVRASRLQAACTRRATRMRMGTRRSKTSTRPRSSSPRSSKSNRVPSLPLRVVQARRRCQRRRRSLPQVQLHHQCQT